MKPTIGQCHFKEAAAYFLMATIALGVVYLLCFFHPVLYVKLVTEDQWGEYATAVSFAVGGFTLLTLALKSTPLLRKIFCILTGIFLLIIAAEEISWGQRIFEDLFHISIVPEALRRINAQAEFNFHNIGVLDSLNRDGLHRGIGFLLLFWCALSAGLFAVNGPLREKIEKVALPLIRPSLLPLFLLVSYFFLLGPLPNWSEIGELFLGLAVAAWAIDLFFRYGMESPPEGVKALSIMTAAFFAIVILTGVLTWKVPGGLTMRLNYLASISYPHYGMYDQAERLYEYMYAHPQYLKPHTRINHARMLLRMGQETRGRDVLKKALSETAPAPRPGQSPGEYFRRQGIIHALLGDTQSADENFFKALEVDREQIYLTENAEQKAELLWSIAQTFEAKGDLSRALVQASQARETATSAALNGKLERWLQQLKDQMENVTSDESF